VPGGLGEEQERVDTSSNTGSIAAAAAHELASYEVAYHLKPMKVVYREVDVQASPSTARQRPRSWQSQQQQQQYYSSEDTDSSTDPDSSSSSSSCSGSTGEALINGNSQHSSADSTVNGAVHATAGNSSSSSSSSSSEQEQSPDLTAVAVLVRQFPQPWKVYLDTGDSKGYRIAG
jgi:hypothetical protein